MREINTWMIEVDEDGNESIAIFGWDDFDWWWLDSPGESAKITERVKQDMLDICIDLAEAGNRRMIQSISELRYSISRWAEARDEAWRKARGEREE